MFKGTESLHSEAFPMSSSCVRTHEAMDESYESEPTRWRPVCQQGTNGHRNQPQGTVIRAFTRELKRMRQAIATFTSRSSSVMTHRSSAGYLLFNKSVIQLNNR